jgi:hypothetical protein
MEPKQPNSWLQSHLKEIVTLLECSGVALLQAIYSPERLSYGWWSVNEPHERQDTVPPLR